MSGGNTKWMEAFGITGLDYPVPVHANTFWYSLGGVTLTCFVVTLVTGAILTQFYNPTPSTAHASVDYIAATPELGWIRGLHHWSANLGFLLLIAHMLRVLVTGAYRPPRVVNYVVGLVLLFVVSQSFFTGTVLKWDQEGYEAMAHFLAGNEMLGPLGKVFQEDFTLSTSMLARFYALHVGIFPSLLVVLIVLHLLYVKYFGIAPKPYQTDEDYEISLSKGEKFTHHLRLLLIFGSILIVLLMVLAFLLPPGLLHQPKPGVEMTKPPWVFWVFYPIESLMGISGILLGTVVLSIVLILIPALGLTIPNKKNLFRIVNTIVIVGLGIWLSQLVITYFLPTMQHFK